VIVYRIIAGSLRLLGGQLLQGPPVRREPDRICPGEAKQAGAEGIVFVKLRGSENSRARETTEWVACEFAARYRKPCPKAVETLLRDWERMVTFYRFPKDHWIHLRTTNVVESPFSAVRLRTDAARRYKKVANAEALIWKILTIAEKKFRRLNSPKLLEHVYNGQLFEDGIEAEEITRKRRAA
jgi:hypothetical protein